MKALWLLPPVRRNLKSSKPTQRTSPKGLGEVFSEFHEIALPVCAFDDRTGEFMRVCADVVPEFVRTHPVHARGTTIGLNSRKSLAQIRVLEYFLKCDSVRHVSLWGLSVSESFRLPPIRRIFSVPRLLLGRIVTSG